MEQDKHIQDQVEKTLQAFDDMPKLEANPFLFTRIQTKLASEKVKNKSIQWNLNLKPIGLAIIVILNIITAVYFINAGSSNTTREQLVYSLSSDYNSTQNDYFMGN